VDGQSSSARRFRDIVDAFTTEVGGELTESKRGLLQQAAGLTMRCEQLQADIINGKPVDDDCWCDYPAPRGDCWGRSPQRLRRISPPAK
jgi:hypothetical protein